MSPKKRRRGHNEGSVYQRADGRWCAVVDLGVVDGKRRRKWVYGKTRKAVAEQLKLLHSQQAQGVALRTSDRQTVGAHLAWWLEHVVKPKNRPNTYASYETQIRLHLAPALGGVKLRALTAPQCQELWNTLARTLAPASVAVCRTVLIAALELAYAWGDVPRNVAKLTTAPPVTRHRPPATDQDKARALLKAAQGDRFAVLFHVALETGARLGELIALRVGDVDLERRRLAIAGTMARTGERGPTKGGKARTLHLSPQLVARLRPLCGDDADAALFGGDKDGAPVAQSTVAAHFKAVLARAGLPKMRFHDLRHWAATLMLASGVMPGVVQQRLGHSSFTITMDVYAHVIPAVEDKAAETMGKLLESDNDDVAS